MKPLFPRNISNTGRLVRGLCAVALLLGAGIGFFVSIWLFVRRDIERIFQSRRQRLKELFASRENASRKSPLPGRDSAPLAR